MNYLTNMYIVQCTYILRNQFSALKMCEKTPKKEPPGYIGNRNSVFVVVLVCTFCFAVCSKQKERLRYINPRD